MTEHAFNAELLSDAKLLSGADQALGLQEITHEPPRLKASNLELRDSARALVAKARACYANAGCDAAEPRKCGFVC